MEKMNYGTAEELINTTVDTAENGSAIVSELQKTKETLEDGERKKVDGYIRGTREALSTMIVDELGGNIAGLYDGGPKPKIDRRVLTVGSSIDTTIAQTKEVNKHELYHDKHDHLAPMKVVDETRGNVAAMIGGKSFNETELIEGLTVTQTGDKFVSSDYVGYKNRLAAAMSSAGLDIADVEKAVDKKDLGLIDDRRQQESPEFSQATAA